MATMKAVGIHEYGGPEVLVYEDAPCPQAGKSEVLVQVHAAGIPLAAMTAWQALFDAGGLSAGQRVLVHGAASTVLYLGAMSALA